MEDLIGKTLGPYQITDRIGETATGTLYKAYQPWLKRHVAIKVLPPHLARDPDFAQRIRAAARLAHRNIASIYDLRQDHGSTFLVTEYVEGTSLDRIVWPGEGLSPKAVLPVLDQLASALEYAHSQGVVHGGLAPGNILLTRDRRPVITDFGLTSARGSNIAADPELLKYMAPEQVQGGAADPRTDVYSLGAVLYYMLTGKAPVKGGNLQAIRNNLIQRPPLPPSRLNRAVPSAVDAVVMKALQKDPERRFQRPKDMAIALRRAVESRTQGLLDHRILQWVAIAVSLVVLFTVTAITTLWMRGGSSAPTPTPASVTQVTRAVPVSGRRLPPTMMLMTTTWTPFPTVVLTEIASATPVPTTTQVPAATATPTVEAPTSTPRPTVTIQPTVTRTSTPVPVFTNTPSPPPTNTPAPPTPTPSPPPTDTPSPLPTNTPPPPPTDTPPPLPTNTPPPPTNTPPPLPTDTRPAPTNTPPPLPTMGIHH